MRFDVAADGRWRCGDRDRTSHAPSLIVRATKGAFGAALITVTLIGRTSPAETALQAPTYTKDIAPLLAERCGVCHLAGGPAPFTLLAYAAPTRHPTAIPPRPPNSA